MTSSSSFHSEKTAVNHIPPLTMSSSNTTLDPNANPIQEPLSEQPQVGKCVDVDHQENHSGNGEVIRDIIIGVADGLTVPFALTAGLSSLGSSKLVIIGGLAELFSGAISMGLGAYLASDTERQKYDAEVLREQDEVQRFPAKERQECYEILEKYNISHDAITPVLDQLCADPKQWIQFMMDFELKLEKPTYKRAFISGGTMAASYFVGGLIPMIPYFAIRDVNHALFVSIGITAVVLLIFGAIKSWFTVGTKRSICYGAFQTLLAGSAAAGASYAIVRAVDSKNPAKCGT